MWHLTETHVVKKYFKSYLQVLILTSGTIEMFNGSHRIW